MDYLPCPAQVADPADGADESLGSLDVPVSGTVVLELASPRPVYLWVDGLPIVLEDLHWRRYERQVRAIAVLPLAAGRHALRAQYGKRPLWPPFVDEHCPSRNRERVRAGLRERLPDRFAISAQVAPGRQAPACCLRVLPTQCVQDGITWQHLLVRPISGFRRDGPLLIHDRPGRLPVQAIALRSPVAPYQCRDVSSAADREAGLHRLLVPIANSFSPLPLARAEGAAEERLEPESVLVQHLSLVLDDATPPLRLSAGDSWLTPASRSAPATVSVTMPVHEDRGRLAPRREHRDLAWPSEEALLAAAPRPQLPGSHEHLRKTWDHAWRMLCRLRRRADPLSGLPNDYVGTAREGFHDHLFVWDSCFSTMALAWGWRAFPVHANLDCLYSRQFDGGYIPRESDVHDGSAAAFEPDFSPNPPILSVSEWKIAALSGDILRLQRVYPALAAQHRWVVANRRLNDGTFWTTGLANGLDNSPSLGDGYPCLTAQMAHDAEMLSLIAGAIGRPDEAHAWEAERQAIGAALNARLWSDERRFYCTSLAGGGHNPNKIVTGFWPLWTGLVPPERVERLAEHLLDPASFWRHHPIPSLAADSPQFVAGGNYWLGSTWAPTNAAAIWGFDRAGRHDLAVRTALRHLEVVEEVRSATGALWENFTSERSERGAWSGPDYSWTAVGPIALLMEVVIGIRPDALANTLRWTLPDGPGWGADRIPLGPASIDLRLDDQRRVCVSSDRAFTLEVLDGGILRRRVVDAGDWRWKPEELPEAAQR